MFKYNVIGLKPGKLEPEGVPLVLVQDSEIPLIRGRVGLQAGDHVRGASSSLSKPSTRKKEEVSSNFQAASSFPYLFDMKDVDHAEQEVESAPDDNAELHHD